VKCGAGMRAARPAKRGQWKGGERPPKVLFEEKVEIHYPQGGTSRERGWERGVNVQLKGDCAPGMGEGLAEKGGTVARERGGV